MVGKPFKGDTMKTFKYLTLLVALIALSHCGREMKNQNQPSVASFRGVRQTVPSACSALQNPRRIVCYEEDSYWDYRAVIDRPVNKTIRVIYRVQSYNLVKQRFLTINRVVYILAKKAQSGPMAVGPYEMMLGIISVNYY